jgi:hypothetical protein
VPAPAADVVETECRCDDEALSILGMLIMRRGQDERREMRDEKTEQREDAT